MNNDITSLGLYFKYMVAMLHWLNGSQSSLLLGCDVILLSSKHNRSLLSPTISHNHKSTLGIIYAPHYLKALKCHHFLSIYPYLYTHQLKFQTKAKQRTCTDNEEGEKAMMS